MIYKDFFGVFVQLPCPDIILRANRTPTKPNQNYNQMKSTVSNSSLPFIIGFCILMNVGSGCASRPQPYPGPETHATTGPALPYRVDGRVYYPLNNSSGFVQQGIASWYGPDFHGKATSNGESPSYK